MKPQKAKPISADTKDVILKMIQQAKEPLTVEKIHKELSGLGKADIKALRNAINEQARTGTIFKWFPKQRKDRFWNQDPEVYAREKILEILSQKRMALTDLENALKKSLFECSKAKAGELRKKLLKILLKEKQVFEHPKTGNERKSRFACNPPDPACYIKKVEKELKNVCNMLGKYHVSREQVFQAVVKTLMPDFEKTESEKAQSDANQVSAREVPSSEDICKMILDKIVEIKPTAKHQALVSIPDLRSSLDLSKQAFDNAILSLAHEQKIFLHKHVYPAQMSQEESEQMVTDSKGNYYMGVVLRNV
ncbi:MAG: hypothetical protein GY749_24040 [Desulfobacteraceae bacterium]|nr:hypothetical protein [Desulfobacteraceae bacterium]